MGWLHPLLFPVFAWECIVEERNDIGIVSFQTDNPCPHHTFIIITNMTQLKVSMVHLWQRENQSNSISIWQCKLVVFGKKTVIWCGVLLLPRGIVLIHQTIKLFTQQHTSRSDACIVKWTKWKQDLDGKC